MFVTTVEKAIDRIYNDGTTNQPREGKRMLRLLRNRTQTGRPLESDSFMSKVEAFLGRRVRPLPVGRQRGWRKDKESGNDHGQCT